MDMGSMETNKTVICIGGEHWAYVFFLSFLFFFFYFFYPLLCRHNPKYSPDNTYRAGFFSFNKLRLGRGVERVQL